MKIQYIPILAALAFAAQIAGAEEPSMPGKSGTTTAFQRPPYVPPAVPSGATAPQLSEPRQKDYGKQSTSTAPNGAKDQPAPIMNGRPDRDMMVSPMSPETAREIRRAEKREIRRENAETARLQQ